ncbi:MAG: TetR/AcrR family transcriptional regulator, partial [Pseudomonadota bacterium]
PETAEKPCSKNSRLAVSGDGLCKEARVSKTSLYKYFGDMVGVLMAVVVQEGDMFELNIDTNPETEEEFWVALIGYGTRLLRLLNTPFCAQLDRIMHEEARNNSSMANGYFENAYGKGHQDVTDLIRIGADRGYIASETSAEDLADHVISLWEGLPWVRARLGLVETPYPDPEKRARRCVDLLFGFESGVVSSRSNSS